MSTNIQSLPGGLIGFNSTPYNIYVHETGGTYTAADTDQVIIMFDNEDVELDPSVLSHGKMLFIKNMSGAAIDINALGGSDIDAAATFTLNNTESVVIICANLELGSIFYILAHYIP